MQKSGSLPCEKSYFKFHVFFTRDWNMNQILSLHRKNTSIVMGKVSTTNQMAFIYLKNKNSFAKCQVNYPLSIIVNYLHSN